MNQQQQDERDRRNLTDADVKALAQAFRDAFYENVGKGVWGMAWKAIVWGIVAVALYGAVKGVK